MAGVEVAPCVDDGDDGSTDELGALPAVLEHPGIAAKGPRTFAEPSVASQFFGLSSLVFGHCLSPSKSVQLLTWETRFCSPSAQVGQFKAIEEEILGRQRAFGS